MNSPRILYIIRAQAGTTILRAGETGDQSYFILSGRAVAGIAPEPGKYRSLSTMTAGDFFGEIAALTGTARTADVVAEADTLLLQLSAKSLRKIMENSSMKALVDAKMSERLGRTGINELPRFVSVDQQDARELRAPQVQEQAGTA